MTFSAVFLAGGYGTRLTTEIAADPSHEFESLLSKPKALLPVQGVPLLDHWLYQLHEAGIDNIFIVTNALFYMQFVEWGLTRNIPSENIVNNGTTTNDTRLGASGDLHLLLQTKQTQLEGQDLLVIAGDTLFYDDFNVHKFLTALPIQTGGVVYYHLNNADETRNRGIIEINETTGLVESLLEKPEPTQTTSRNACPALYAYRSTTVPDIHRFIEETAHLPLKDRDAPGKLLSWLIEQQKVPIFAYKVNGRFDIGNLSEYRATVAYFTSKWQEKLQAIDTPTSINSSNNHHHQQQQPVLPTYVCQKCPARVGFMGNPSDGFEGKTLSFLIENFCASVTIQANEHPGDLTVSLIPHPVLDPSSYQGIDGVQLHTLCKGYYGGIRLLQATCKAFGDRCSRVGLMVHRQRGFRMSYDTNIPRMVGLSGSSAIVVAAFRSLMSFFHLSLDDFHIQQEAFPQVILDVEKCELGIAAGLQDRVVQTYGGLVHMDFSIPSQAPKYISISPTLLPPMYLCYNKHAGGESGKVHSTVKERWAQRDPSLVAGMKKLGTLADAAVACLQNDQGGPTHSPSMIALGELMATNFATRRSLYGDGPVGQLNIAMIDLAHTLQLNAKFTGSGGALVCIRKDGQGWLSDEKEAEAKAAYLEHGFEFIRIQIPTT